MRLYWIFFVSTAVHSENFVKTRQQHEMSCQQPRIWGYLWFFRSRIWAKLRST